MFDLTDFESWRAATVAANEFQIRPITFAESEEWSFRSGRFVHSSRGSFELSGLQAEARHPCLDGQEQLIIRQRTIAINGFLLRRVQAGVEILFQGRVEPGNVGVMHLAPTVQSTEANYRQLHGGKSTAFIEHFLEDDATYLYDALQSEEGSRYHGKYNRNVVRLLRDQEIELSAGFRFITFDQFKQLVERPNVINTDSRSVLCCLDWKYLTWPRTPFSVAESDTSLLLKHSYCQPLSEAGTTPFETVSWLASLRAAVSIATAPVPIEGLKNWIIEEDTITERVLDLGFSARQFRVIAKQREVPSWDQPLIDSGTRGRILLLCQLRDNVLQFLISASYEIGFLEGVQLSATIVVPPGKKGCSLTPRNRHFLDLAEADDGSTLIARCVQSEEGGRFFQDENLFEIVLLDPASDVPPSDEHRWMTLSQITALKRVSGVLTMELRCILVLLFKFL